MQKASAERVGMNSFEFEFIANFVETQAGIVLEKGKEYLAERNLQSVCRSEGISSIKELVWKLKNNQNVSDLKNKVIQSMTINETLFFRDGYPFDDLKSHVLPKLASSLESKKTLNIWSSSCSTGQEPYSVALIIKQYFSAFSEWELNFFATDIDPEALGKAKAGIYNSMEISRGLPEVMKNRFTVEDGRNRKIKDEIRSMIEFKVVNLMEAWPFKVKFNLILLRNTLIYFKPETKRMLLHKIRRFIDNDGYLLLSAADIFQQSEVPFRQENIGKSVFYRPT